MGKRFTDTCKWDKAWYRALKPSAKCAWQYLCDKCDIAGVIEPDRALADFVIGDTLDWDVFIEAAGSRIRKLDCGKLWLEGFVSFQYGALSEDCKPHQATLKILRKYAESERVIEGYLKGIHTLKDKEKDKDQGKKSSKKKRKAISAEDVPVPDGFDTPEVRHAISDWFAYKAKRGEPYRDAAYFGRKVAEFTGAGSAAFIAAVNSSIGSNYSGLFPAKGSNGNQPTSHRVGSGQRYRG